MQKEILKSVNPLPTKQLFANQIFDLLRLLDKREKSSDSAQSQGMMVRGSPAHTLWSHKYTQAQFCIIFSTQSHPRTQTGVTCAHSHFPESPAHTRAHTAIFQSHPRTQTGVTSTHRHNFASFFHQESPAHTSHGIGWGGVGMMTVFCTCTHVQSAAQWTASVHTLHMSKPVM